MCKKEEINITIDGLVLANLVNGLMIITEDDSRKYKIKLSRKIPMKTLELREPEPTTTPALQEPMKKEEGD